MASISIVKTSTPAGPVNTGETITSTVTLVNEGSSSASNVIFQDLIPAVPAGTTRTWTLTQTGGVIGSAGAGVGDINETLSVFPAGGRLVYTISDTVTNPGAYKNIASVDVPGQPPTDGEGPDIDVNVPPTEQLFSECATDLVKICSQTNIEKVCIDGVPGYFVAISTSDGDLIPVNDTSIPAGPNMGPYTTIGFVRSYYTDLSGTYIPNPTVISPECPELNLDSEIICLVPNGGPEGTDPVTGVLTVDNTVMPPVTISNEITVIPSACKTEVPLPEVLATVSRQQNSAITSGQHLEHDLVFTGAVEEYIPVTLFLYTVASGIVVDSSTLNQSILVQV